MGKVVKGAKPSTIGCEERTTRSIASQKVSSTMKIGLEGRRAYLCKKHYKEFKKLTRTERKVERLRYSII